MCTKVKASQKLAYASSKFEKYVVCTMLSGNANSYKGESLVSPFISDRTSVSKIASSSESSES